ncbi:MAG: 2-hydroxyacyl-CoA dehydratase, partial [Anaerolineae bacterium]
MPDPDPTVRFIHADPGPTVGLLSGYLPRELFHAVGCTPVRLFPTAAKPTAAEAYLPRNFCALTRLILASFLEDGAPQLDAVIFTDEDDAARRLYDVWRSHLPLPAWGFVQVPRAATPLAARRYADLLARLSADLEARAGRSLRAAPLRQAIALFNRQRGLLGNLKRHWLAGYVDTASYRRLRRAALTKAPLVANRQLENTLAEIESGAPPHPTPPTAAVSPRLLLLAELAAPADLVRLVEAAGAQVVAEDSDLDEGDLSAPVPADAETVE